LADPHAVQNNCQLARDGDCGLSEPSRNFIVVISDLLLPGVGTLKKGEKGRRAIAVLRLFAL
jgi:hypothetical protein